MSTESIYDNIPQNEMRTDYDDAEHSDLMTSLINKQTENVELRLKVAELQRSADQWMHECAKAKVALATLQIEADKLRAEIAALKGAAA